MYLCSSVLTHLNSVSLLFSSTGLQTCSISVLCLLTVHFILLRRLKPNAHTPRMLLHWVRPWMWKIPLAPHNIFTHLHPPSLHRAALHRVNPADSPHSAGTAASRSHQQQADILGHILTPGEEIQTASVSDRHKHVKLR